MGLLDEFKRLAHPYEDEEEDDYDEYDAPAPRAERQDRSDRSDRAAERAERRERTGSLYGSAPMLDEERRSNKVVNIRAATQLQVVLVKPEKFEDASSIADHLRAGMLRNLHLRPSRENILRTSASLFWLQTHPLR